MSLLKTNDLSKEIKLLSTKDYKFLLGRMYFMGDDGLQIVLFISQHLVRHNYKRTRALIIMYFTGDDGT